jgi:hypothetical protein
MHTHADGRYSVSYISSDAQLDESFANLLHGGAIALVPSTAADGSLLAGPHTKSCCNFIGHAELIVVQRVHDVVSHTGGVPTRVPAGLELLLHSMLNLSCYRLLLGDNASVLYTHGKLSQNGNMSSMCGHHINAPADLQAVAGGLQRAPLLPLLAVWPAATCADSTDGR